MRELRFDQIDDTRATPAALYEEVLACRETLDTFLEEFDEILRVGGCGLSGDCLDQGQHVLRPVIDLTHQQSDLLFAFFLLGDVGVGTEPEHDLAGLITDRQRARQEPAIFAVPATQRKGVLPRFAAVPGFLDACDHAVDVIRVMHALPTPALHLLQRRTRVVVPAPVVPEDPSCRVRHPGELTHVVGECAEAFLALVQSFPGIVNGGDIARDRGRADDDIVVVEDRRDGHAHEYGAAVLSQAHRLDILHLVATCDAGEKAFLFGDPIRGHQTPDRFADHLIGRVAEDALGRLVPGHDGSRKRLAYDGIGG